MEGAQLEQTFLHERRAVNASISTLRGTVDFVPAYSGGYLYTDDNGEYPTVIDLSTCTLEPNIPILVEHNHRDYQDIAGQITSIRVENDQIVATEILERRRRLRW